VAEGKARVNKLVSAYSSQHSEGPELTQAVQELCQQASAFVLVVDTSKVEGEGQCLVAMGDHLLVSSPDPHELSCLRATSRTCLLLHVL